MKPIPLEYSYSSSMIFFMCPKCGERKSTTGRRRFKVLDIDSMGRKVSNWQCAECSPKDKELPALKVHCAVPQPHGDEEVWEGKSICGRPHKNDAEEGNPSRVTAKPELVTCSYCLMQMRIKEPK